MLSPWLRRQIGISYALAAMHFAWFWVPIWVLFYRRYTDYAGVGILEALTMAVSSGAILPAGMLADRIGKRPTLILAGFVTAIGGGVTGIAGSVTAVGVGVVLLSLGGALYLSAMEAFQYDTLKTEGREDAYPRVLSVTTTIRMISCALSSIAGGWMYAIEPRLPFLGVGAVALAAGGLGFWLTEPAVDTEHTQLGSLGRQLAHGLGSLIRPGIWPLAAAIVAVGILLTADSSGFWDIQAVAYGLDSRALGILYTSVYVAMALVSSGFGRVSRRLGNLPILGVTAAGFAGALLISPVVGALGGSLFLIVRSACSVVFDLRTSVILNGVIPSRVRATTLSAVSAVRGIPYIVLAYFLGRTIDATGTAPVAMGMGLAMTVAAGMLILVLSVRPAPGAADAS
jgi:MFS family permease